MDGEALWMGCRWKSPERVHQNNDLDALRATWQAGTIEERCCRVVREATAIHVPQQPQPSHAFGVSSDGDDVTGGNRNHMHD